MTDLLDEGIEAIDNRTWDDMSLAWQKMWIGKTDIKGAPDIEITYRPFPPFFLYSYIGTDRPVPTKIKKTVITKDGDRRVKEEYVYD